MSAEMDRKERTLLSLEGLSVGDALGERFFGPVVEAIERMMAREVPPGPWGYTDDTEMALSVCEVLLERGELDPDDLAAAFARRFSPNRGYGGGAYNLIQAFQRGASWKQAAPAMFKGSGSYGNGAAMRVAPLGAYVADNLDAVVVQAKRSALVTHAHPEGVAGAVAVAVAAATVYQQSVSDSLDAAELFEIVLGRTPNSTTRKRILEASNLSSNTRPDEAARQLGSGQEVSSQDTVPFVLWCAAHNLSDYETAFWQTVSGLGDRDTTCAMVGGIVALSSRSVPAKWVAQREHLPEL